MSKILMKCGHIANAVTTDGKPCCAICYGITQDAVIPAEKQPDLTHRKAKCAYCGRITESREDLPFFSYRPGHEYDSYYCGCGGWD